MKKMTHEEFLSKFYSRFTDDDKYTVLERYEGFDKKILVRHENCGTEWYVRPKELIRKTNPTHCPTCGKKMLTKEKLSKIITDDFEIVGDITGVNELVTFKHLACGHTFSRRPGEFIYRQNYKLKCPICGKKENTKNYAEKFKRYVDKLGEYTLLSDYTISATKVLMKHNICGHTWHVTPRDFMSKERRCPNCFGGVRKTLDSFKEYVDAIDNGIYELVSDEYINNKTHVNILHKTCGHTFSTRPDNFKNGHRCPFCFSARSQLEKDLFEFVKELEPTAEHNVRLQNKQELDIYIPDKKIAIEFNGLYWHSEEFKSKKYHQEKMLECEKLGIRLIQIFEDEWVNHGLIVKEKLSHIFKKANNTKPHIYARKCHIREISSSDAFRFLNLYHLQGSDNSGIRFGLFYEQELVSVMTFSKPRIIFNTNKIDTATTFELVRFANNTNYIVVGSFGKLLNHFKQHNPNAERIISYADLRWTDKNSNIYLKNNFKLEKISEPNYWYVQPRNTVREHRFKYRKQLLKQKFPKIYSETKTELQIMQEAGISRIYDAGTALFALNIKN